MGDIVIPASLVVVLTPMISFLVIKLLASKDAQIASEREDKLAYRDLLFNSMKQANRATNAAERATDVLAREKS